MLDGTITDAVEARSLSLNPQVIQRLWVFFLIFNAWCPGINGVHGIHGVLVSIICVRPEEEQYQKDVHIYSASWGPDDDGRTVDGPGPLTR